MSFSNPTLAQIVMFAGNFAPRGWALCDGQLLAISQYQSLYSLLGTTYGGDGRTSFGLPDLRGRTPRHAGHGNGLSPVQLGSKSGTNQHYLSQGQMPSHSHPHTHSASFHAEQRVGNEGTPKDNVFAVTDKLIYHDVDSGREDILMHGNTVTVASAGPPVGSNQEFAIDNPFMGINHIIALTGTFPSRN